ncbi:MAG: RnfABCDGE type electron transport complex subunit D [Treponema sp.]|jgi:electron transport complex protein RnfD|nr:RnfABCDGE type electron transport complex subunit D [Treponema sp.]
MRDKDSILDQKPQVNLSQPTAGRMYLVCVCAGLGIVQSALTDTFHSLAVALCALGAALITELAAGGFDRQHRVIRDGSAAVTALILTLLLPNRIHPIYVIPGAVFAIAVVKYSFGGLGSNWLNPALGGWFFIRLSWPGAFGRSLEGSPLSIITEILGGGVSNPQGSPLGLLKISGAGNAAFSASLLDNTVSSVLNGTIFSITGAKLPSGYIDLLFSRAPGIIADRGLMALLLGTIIVTASQAGRVWIPAVYLFCYGILVRAFGALPFGGAAGEGDMLFGFFTGGTMAAAFLLAADPATGPKSRAGSLAAAILAALFSWIFRYWGREPYGAFFAAALVNVLTPLIRSIEDRLLYPVNRRHPA